MLKKGIGVAGTIPLLAQRAVADSPRWTRAVGIIPPTPYGDDDDHTHVFDHGPAGVRSQLDGRCITLLRCCYADPHKLQGYLPENCN